MYRVPPSTEPAPSHRPRPGERRGFFERPDSPGPSTGTSVGEVTRPAGQRVRTRARGFPRRHRDHRRHAEHRRTSTPATCTSACPARTGTVPSSPLQAREGGAVALLTDAAGAEIARASGLPVVLVDSPRAALGDVSAWVYRTDGDDAPAALRGHRHQRQDRRPSYLLEGILRAAGPRHRAQQHGRAPHRRPHRRQPPHHARGQRDARPPGPHARERGPRRRRRGQRAGTQPQPRRRPRLRRRRRSRTSATTTSTTTPTWRSTSRRSCRCSSPTGPARASSRSTRPTGSASSTRPASRSRRSPSSPDVEADWTVEILDEQAAYTEFRLSGPEGRSLVTRVPLIGWHMAGERRPRHRHAGRGGLRARGHRSGARRRRRHRRLPARAHRARLGRHAGRASSSTSATAPTRS